MTAIVLSVNFGARRRFSVAGGWFQRAQRLLAEEPDGPEHGFLAWAGTMFALALATADHDGAIRAARRAFDLGQAVSLTCRPLGSSSRATSWCGRPGSTRDSA
jgi:hypothetical protein